MLTLQEKISERHAALFRRMLDIKGDLPDFLLAKFFSIKKLTDRVDGNLGPFDLAHIAISCGFNTETMTFGDEPVVVMPEKELSTTNPPNEATEAHPEPDNELAEEVLPNGTPVEILVDDVFTEGKITDTEVGEEGRKYKVETESGDEYMVTEEGIDVRE